MKLLMKSLFLGVIGIALISPAMLSAQTLNGKIVRVVVPFSPGAAADTVARFIGSGLAAKWSVPVIIENRPGANTILGMELVARSEPDGTTLLFTSDDSFSIVPHLQKKMNLNPLKDLTPINLSAKILVMIVANASVAANTLPELIDFARANPGKLSYGSYGSGTTVQLAMEMLKAEAKIDILHVPYKGNAPAVRAVIADEVNLALGGLGTMRAHFEAGRLKPIAIAAPERMPELPNVGTMGEAGYGGIDATVWWGFAAPARTPEGIIKRLNQDISAFLNLPESKKFIEKLDLSIADIGPAEAADKLSRDYKIRGDQIRQFGLGDVGSQ